MNIELFKNLFTVIFTAFGSLIGSFSNVVILRMASGTSVVFPPSACPACNHRLSAFDLVPVLSWLQLGGKCRYCKASISYQYPLVEATIAAIVGLSFYKYGFSLNYILCSAGAIIWFISSVLFIRNEVHKAQPFIWASIYLLAFNLILSSNHLQSFQISLISLSIAIVIALLGSHKSPESFYSWGALGFISGLKVFIILPYLVLLPLLVASIKYLKPASNIPNKLFFAIQYIFIFLAIVLN